MQTTSRPRVGLGFRFVFGLAFRMTTAGACQSPQLAALESVEFLPCHDRVSVVSIVSCGISGLVPSNHGGPQDLRVSAGFDVHTLSHTCARLHTLAHTHTHTCTHTHILARTCTHLHALAHILAHANAHANAHAHAHVHAHTQSNTHTHTPTPYIGCL
jgi:hypothetical protein